MTVSRRVLLLGVLAAGLGACGKVGPVQPPPGADPAYPRQYPPPDSVVPPSSGGGRSDADTGDAE